MNEKNVIFTSANLGERTIDFINSYNKTYIFFNNTKLDKLGWSYVDLKTTKAFYSQIKELAAAGKKLIIAMNNKTGQMMMLVKILEQYGRILTVTADDDYSARNVANWVNYDFVIHTPTIEAGVNFLPNNHFDHICGFFLKNANTYDSCYQMLFRVRNPISKTIYLYAEKGFNLLSDDLNDQDEAERCIQIEENMVKSGKNKLSFNSASFIYGKYQHPVYKAIIRQNFFMKYSQTYFKSLLIKELEKSGIVCEEVVEDAFFILPKKGELTKLYNKSIIGKICNADIGESRGAMQEHIFKLKEIEIPVDMDILKDLCDEEHKITDRIQAIRNYFGIKREKYDYFNKEQVAVAQFIEIVKPDKSYTPDEFNKLIYNYFEQYYDVFTATFGNRQYTLERILKMQMRYKVQMLNKKLETCFYKSRKGMLETLNPMIIHNIERMIEQKEKAKANEIKQYENTDTI